MPFVQLKRLIAALILAPVISPVALGVRAQPAIQPQDGAPAAPAAAPQSQPLGADKVDGTSGKKGKPSVYGMATKPGFFAVVEQSTNWTFPRTGTAWGVGAAAGATFVGIGVKGNISGTKDNLLSWSAQLGPSFTHVYDVPGRDATPLRIDLFASLSPLRGDSLNIYTAWRGVAGNDVLGERRFQNTVRTGVIYSFAGSRIIPDAIEEINLPERGFYGRVEPSWLFAVDGQLNQVQTQAYLGWSETLYPFTFAIEAGPQFIQTARRELQTNLGSLLDLGYVINRKTRAYLRYRPSLSFGGNAYPAATQVLQAGINYSF